MSIKINRRKESSSTEEVKYTNFFYSSEDDSNEEPLEEKIIKLPSMEYLGSEEDTEEDTEEEILSFSKINILTLSPDIVIDKINSFLKPFESVNISTLNKAMLTFKCKMAIDLSNIMLTTENIIQYARFMMQYKIIGLKLDVGNQKLNMIALKPLFAQVNILIIPYNVEESSDAQIVYNIHNIITYCKNIGTLQCCPREEWLQEIASKKYLSQLNLTLDKKMSLHSLSHARKLTNLVLNADETVELVFISKLKYLRYLEIHDAKGIKHLNKCKKLEVLILKSIDINDSDILNEMIKEIRSLSHLKRLIVENSPNLGVHFDLNGMKNLEYVSFNTFIYQSINMDNCLKLKGLYILNTADEEFVSLSVLGCIALEEIVLKSISLKDFDFISECTSLKHFHFTEAAITYFHNLHSFSELIQIESIVINTDSIIYDLDNMNNMKKLVKLKSVILKAMSNLVNIDGLANCTSLIHLTLKGSHKLLDIASLSQCVLLKSLFIETSNIKSVKALRNCTSLREIYLHSNRLKNITSFCHFKQLNTLTLVGNKVKRLFPLKGCTALRELSLDNLIELTSLEGLEECKQLRYINMRMCYKLNNISALNGCSSLERAEILCFKITSYNALLQCTKLTKLVLGYIDKVDLKPLYAHPSLRVLQEYNMDNYISTPIMGPISSI
jgi:hypothetical protein